MIGIVSYGVYVPAYRVKVEDVAKQWGENPANIKAGLLVEEKSVPDLDEDKATIAVESARAAILRANIDPKGIGALYVGSESHPYAVKQSSPGDALMEKTGLRPNDFDFVVFHQPNGKFPLRTAKNLGFSSAQIKSGLRLTHFGNTHSASSWIGLAATLDKASPSQRILMTSFGSGVGSAAFAFRVTDAPLNLL